MTLSASPMSAGTAAFRSPQSESWGRHAILDIIRREAADVIMTDPHQEGGLMAMKKISACAKPPGSLSSITPSMSRP